MCVLGGSQLETESFYMYGWTSLKGEKTFLKPDELRADESSSLRPGRRGLGGDLSQSTLGCCCISVCWWRQLESDRQPGGMSSAS